MKQKVDRISGLLLLFATCFGINMTKAQTPVLSLDLANAKTEVSPMLYGLMTEEINHSYDGGLYGELIRNRIFKDNKKVPEAWSLVTSGSSKSSIKLIGAEDHVPRDERGHAINGALSVCLRLTVEKAEGRVGIANEGYWGIPIRPSTTYKASFYLKGTARKDPPRWAWEPKPTKPSPPDIANNTPGPITVSLESKDGKIIYATGVVNLEKSIYWKKYELNLTTSSGMKPTKDARFVISTNRTGLYYFNLVSLFPPTYENQPNGFRVDLMNMLIDMKPKFLRFPGGNFLEGPKITDAFPWKETLGPLEGRPGHNGSWGYRPSDGMGLLEFLMWAQNMNAEPLLGVYAGYSLDGDHVDAGPLLKPYVDDALDEIEYVIGDTTTYWGAKRAADGHPEPFKLKYIEIGNEDFFDRSKSYVGRFNQFRKAIKEKYPQLICISTMEAKEFNRPDNAAGKLPEVIDEHYYRNAWDMWENATQYDSYDRNGPKIFVGEWATREGVPTTNLNAALGDAAWMTGMERNSDLVIMSCYAPLFVNVSKDSITGSKAWQWDSDLIGYDALNSYGSPSYYVQMLFSNYLGNKIVPIVSENIPVQKVPLNKRDSAMGKKPSTVPTLFYSATVNDATGKLYLKIVNTISKPQKIKINLDGAAKISSEAKLFMIKGSSPDATNSITHPRNIVPVTESIKGIEPKFSRTLDPYSVNIFEIDSVE
ncbi:alpha-L-arabinofuranosidase C-terminal domain-containing protein [Arachidicoccus terrestris]|uniref:alpha-L-arabinofuranosidase C-terminal domain-containing protein n=1 Tax=Arachidicoccus terrestris TaxID=2875539 RepID=UPI001CC78859|nr:alpha-L-arabinofuranosidase C-terminal domain-containing protein [Arachidicoccus terrestris]UAY57027.1 alpha-N-arabinofuranosidase [Arachidicoccus terrestris]